MGVGVWRVFCDAMSGGCGAHLLASASRPTQHFPSCIARSRHTLRLAFLANDARGRGPVWGRRSRGARRRKTFSEVVQSAVDRFSASPYSPPTHDGHTTASNNSRGMEAAKVLPFQETSNLPTLRRRSSDRKSISHHHTHKEHVSGSIVSGETTVSLTSTLAAAPRSTDASPRFESLPGGSSPTHLESSAQARKRDCVQSLPERFPRPLPPWDVSFSGSFFMRPLKRAGDR